jgi:hypothetical protein
MSLFLTEALKALIAKINFILYKPSSKVILFEKYFVRKLFCSKENLIDCYFVRKLFCSKVNLFESYVALREPVAIKSMVF